MGKPWKLEFLREYEELCRKYNAMVVMQDVGGYETFAVATVDNAESELEKALEEMRKTAALHLVGAS
jgi:RIO-like serine/threonine protein kinase